jgi:hypothetical protein
LPTGRKVIIPPTWTEPVDWIDSSIIMAVSSQTIKNSPEYNPAITLDRDYEKPSMIFTACLITG